MHTAPEDVCYMLLEQYAFQIWSWSIFDLEYSSRLLMVQDHMCTVTSKGCICRYSGIHVYQPVKVIILDVNTSLLHVSLRSPCMPTQLILSHFYGFVILIKFYRFITLYNVMPTNASFLYDRTHMDHKSRPKSQKSTLLLNCMQFAESASSKYKCACYHTNWLTFTL